VLIVYKCVCADYNIIILILQEGTGGMIRKEMNVQNVINDIRKVLSINPGLIKKAGIFGSLARGDFNEESDIDLLMWYDSPPVFSMEKITRYCELCAEIETTLINSYQRSVDIADIEDDSLSNMYDPDIKNEVIWI
jgi:predicted nucleotidyltransferase